MEEVMRTWDLTPVVQFMGCPAPRDRSHPAVGF